MPGPEATRVTHENGTTILVAGGGPTSTTTVMHPDGTTIIMETAETVGGAVTTTTVTHADGTRGSASMQVEY